MTPDPDKTRTLFGSGPVAAAAETLDWNRTPLGPPADWAPSLTMAATICMASSEPCALFVFPHMCLLFNDAYAQAAFGGRTSALAQTIEQLAGDRAPQLHATLRSVVRNSPPRPVAEDFTTQLLDRTLAAEPRLDPVPGIDGQVGVYLRLHSRTELTGTVSAAPDSEERLRLIVDSARDYAIFTADAQGVIDGWPQGAEAVFGWSASEAIGRPAAILFVAEDRVAGVPAQEFGQAAQEGYAPDIRWHLHKNGHRVFIDGSVRPLRDPHGALQGFLKIGQDVTQRRSDELALRTSEQRFRVLTNAIPHLVFRGNVDGRRTWNSRQWLEFTGQNAQGSRGLGWLMAVHPDDREATLAGWQSAVFDGEYVVDHRIRRASDGHYRWYQTRAVPVSPSDPAISEWVGTSSDVHDRRRSQDQQKLMLAELQHRTYNLLAIVRAIFSETANDAVTLDAVRERFSHRLAALSRVHGMLGQSENGRATIAGLIQLELDALAPSDSRITLSGPVVELTPSSIQVLSLAIHELCTNALKYGALADRRGRLHVSWTAADEGARAGQLRVVWSEDFGRPIDATPPASEGFGRQLIEHALPYQLGAQTTYRLERDRLECSIELPLAKPPAPASAPSIL